jgi:hypothetical protein
MFKAALEGHGGARCQNLSTLIDPLEGPSVLCMTKMQDHDTAELSQKMHLESCLSYYIMLSTRTKYL